MKWCFTVGVTLLCVVLLFVPITTKAAVSEAEYQATLLELITSLRQQIVLLEAELAKRQAVKGSLGVTEYEAGYLSGMVTITDSYNIFSEDDVSKISNRRQRDYFERVFTLFPDEYDSRLGRMAVFRDQNSAFDAFVETIPPEHETWMYAVSEDILEDPTAQWNTELIVHELAHIISYDSAQDVSPVDVLSCESYFKRHGCPATQTYLRLFVDEFWTASDLRRAEQWESLSAAHDTVNRYYKTHRVDYVSSYAANGPEEDFAESFMFFVLDLEVSGERAQRKVDFFTQFADLRAIKAKINMVAQG